MKLKSVIFSLLDKCIRANEITDNSNNVGHFLKFFKREFHVYIVHIELVRMNRTIESYFCENLLIDVAYYHIPVKRKLEIVYKGINSG